MTKRKSEDPFEVGYGKPPQHGQFKPGRSGNPSGRPKGATGFDASLVRELEAKITVTEGGIRKTISKSEAASKRLVEKALKGDMPALRYIGEIDRNFAATVEARIKLDVEDGKAVAIDTVDEDILRHFAEQARKQAEPTTLKGAEE